MDLAPIVQAHYIYGVNYFYVMICPSMERELAHTQCSYVWRQLTWVLDIVRQDVLYTCVPPTHPRANSYDNHFVQVKDVRRVKPTLLLVTTQGKLITIKLFKGLLFSATLWSQPQNARIWLSKTSRCYVREPTLAQGTNCNFGANYN